MNTPTHDNSPDLGQLAEEASALLAATADLTGEQIGAARQRLTAALERGRHLYGKVHDQTLKVAHAADKSVHESPYQAIAVAAAAGLLLGYVISRRCACQQTN
jgi:ElaB/YqjD/DUF883 family membrane-anchored ribosome-binding protein